MPDVADEVISACRGCGYEFLRSSAEKLWQDGWSYYECPCLGTYVDLPIDPPKEEMAEH